jgi:hypothetical protein
VDSRHDLSKIAVIDVSEGEKVMMGIIHPATFLLLLECIDIDVGPHNV